MLTLFLLMSCSDKNKTTENGETVSNKKSKTLKTEPKQPLTDNFKNYWYAGDAEITSYQLNQARYGELREGNAVLIYVTEPFLPKKQVKADNSSPENISVLKLNATKNFLTGIYPYSIMSSTFYPVYDNQHAVKTSLSVQEWCGHVFMQLNNKGKDYNLLARSYFESEGDVEVNLDKIWLEDELAFLGNCPWEQDLIYVRKVCDQLQVPLKIVSLQKEYWEHVGAYTVAEVKVGRTPNPDIFCNKLIK